MIKEKCRSEAMKIGLRTIKTALGAAIAIFIADYLKLDYAVSAGVITILSVQNTKKKSITLAGQRFLSTALAIAIAIFFFLIIGFNPVSFGLYLLIFIPIASKLQLTDGIVVSSVLVTHLLIEESASFHWVLNCFLLMFVGVGTAIVLNLYMPSSEKKLKELQLMIEKDMKLVLLDFSKALKHVTEPHQLDASLQELNVTVLKAEKLAMEQFNNRLFDQSYYYIKYFDMRKMQLYVLKQIKVDITLCQLPTEQNKKLAEIFVATAESLHEDNPVIELLEEIKALFDYFRNSPLPTTRPEFENRAMLFQMLNDFNYFIEIKKVFYEEFRTERQLAQGE